MTRRPLSAFLARLIWLCMAPLLLLSIWLAWDTLEQQEEIHLRAGADEAHNFAAAIDQHLRARINALHMLAISPLVDDPRRWPDLYAEAQGFRESFGLHVIFADTDRQMLFNTRLPFGARLPRLPDSKGKTAAPLALETGQPQVGDIVISPIDQKLLVAIAVPVLRAGKPTRLMLSIFETRQFQERLDQLALPAGWSIALVDSTSAVIARRAPPGFDSARDVADDHRFTVRSVLSPWSVVVEIPRSHHREVLYKSFVYLGVGIVLATLLGLLGGTLAGRRLGQQVKALSEPPGMEMPPLQIAEIAVAHAQLVSARDELRASHDRLAEAERIAHVGSWELDLVHQRLAWSDEVYRIFGLQPQVFGATYAAFLDCVHPDDRQAVDDAYSSSLRENRDSYEIVHRIVRKDDGAIRVVLEKCQHSRDADGRIVLSLGMVHDITERRQAEQAQAEQLEQQRAARLAALNRMEDANAARRQVLELNASLERRVEERTTELASANRELESFAYAVSHDLRAPLRALSGFSQALVEDCGDQLQGEAKVYLEQIMTASRRMGELIDGILALSRSTRGELRQDRVDLSALARRHLDELARAEPERQVAVAVDDRLVARGDARMLEAVLTNLLDNAWKYTAKTAAPTIRVHHGEVNGVAGFCVADNGAGFDMAHAARLFKPFQRLHRQDEFPGIGIGLATVQRIIHRHGGEIVATAAPGQGATFCFTLPASDREMTT